MRIKLNYIAPGLAAAAIGGAIALAPVASADSDPWLASARDDPSGMSYRSG